MRVKAGFLRVLVSFLITPVVIFILHLHQLQEYSSLVNPRFNFVALDGSPLFAECGIAHRSLFLHMLQPNVSTQDENTEYENVTGYTVNCSLVVSGDNVELLDAERSQAIRSHQAYNDLTNQELIESTADCRVFKESRYYIVDPELVSVEERDFPVAFGIYVYRDAGQFERLLRAIYRSHNLYCVHLDNSTNEEVKLAVESLVRCFPNVMLVEDAVDVKWGSWTVLEAELRCMALLVKHPGWQYYMNLSGQEFPLHSMWYLAHVLKSLKKYNAVIAAPLAWERAKIRSRVEYSYDDRGKKIGPKTAQPPLNITIYKGELHMAVTRGFVEFVLTDERPRILADWMRDTHVPDENYFTTINYNYEVFQAPGAKPEAANLEFYSKVNYRDPGLSLRYKNWRESYCSGRFQRGICVLGVRDVPLVARSPALFVNKMESGFHPLAYDCLEQLQRNRTLCIQDPPRAG